MRSFISYLYLLFIGITCIFFFVGAVCLWALTILFDSRLVLLHYYTSFWAYFYVLMMPAWRVRFHDTGNIDRRRTYVVVSNHQSLLDILVVFGLYFPFKWVSKTEIFKVPFVGWNMVLNRYIRLDRGNKDSASQMMQSAEQHLRNGSSVYIFPEGTRSKDGQIRDFKPGAFILAKKLGLPILPVVINGSTHALPKHSLTFQGIHPIDVKVLPAIEPETFAELEAPALLENVHRLFVVELQKLKNETGGLPPESP